MKIAVEKLEANPFRKISKYPFDKEKLKALKTSIKETDFWDNILARKSPQNRGHYQIAYGHHRWKVLKQLGFKHVDIPVRELDDATMIKIMANENMDFWAMNPAVINETVLTTKAFLDSEFHKHRYLKDLPSQLARGLDLKDENRYQQMRSRTVGAPTISAFLGRNWGVGTVARALSILSAEKRGLIDRKAVESLPSMRQAAAFTREATKKNRVISKKSQAGLIKKIRAEAGSGQEIAGRVAEFRMDATRKQLKKQPKIPPMLDELVIDITDAMRQLTTDLNGIKKNFANIQKRRVLINFDIKLNQLKKVVDEIAGKDIANG